MWSCCCQGSCIIDKTSVRDRESFRYRNMAPIEMLNQMLNMQTHHHDRCIKANDLESQKRCGPIGYFLMLDTYRWVKYDSPLKEPCAICVNELFWKFLNEIDVSRIILWWDQRSTDFRSIDRHKHTCYARLKKKNSSSNIHPIQSAKPWK